VAADSLEALRRELEALDPSSIPSSANPSTFFNANDGTHAMLREYLLGLVTARSGDGPRALQHGDRLAAMPPPPSGGLQPAELGTALRAHVERFAGRPLPALDEIERLEIHVWYEPTIASPYTSMALERFTRAELLRETGRDREALAWYANFIATSAYETIYRAPSDLAQGRIYEKLGDRQRAAEHYRRVVDLWRRCDPELVPLRQEAETALARLE
jgi:tetratricopeptide (TPR) repeat protein